MSFWKIAWRNIKQRALSSSLTGLSMALGVALMILVIVIHDVTVEQFSNDAQGYHLIVGGSKGGDLQLVFTTVFHQGRPLYPIPYSYYKKFTEGEFAPYTAVAVPYCLGDSLQAEGQQFRVVATTPDLFDKISYGANADGTDKKYSFQEGRNFKSDHFFEAVIGSFAARQTGLKVGDKFQPTHGMSAEGDKHTEFTVVGILAPTGTANDRAIFANIEGFYLLEGHALTPEEGKIATSVDKALKDKTRAQTADPDDPNHGMQPLPEDQREVTSILVLCKEDTGTEAMTLDSKINKGRDRIAQAIAPGFVVERFLQTIVGPVQIVLFVLTILIIIVAGISILVSIYNSMSERSHDIAVMRALGASRTAVMGIILVESILLSLLGGLAGVLLGHAVLGIVGPIVESHTGIALRFWDFNWQESLLIPGLVVFASLVGFLPALTAYRTDVARILGGGR